MKKIIATIFGLSILAGCTDTDVVNSNLNNSALQFELNRRVVFYNGITGSYILAIEGRCAMSYGGSTQVSVTCKVGPSEYKRHMLGISDNVTYFVEQLEPSTESAYHYRVIFKPQTILPDVDFKGDAGELMSEGK